jgi:DNA-binding transcriptional MerR regulator
MSDQRLTFKEMCAAFEVTPRTLRYYEYIELIAPEREGRSRFYHPRDVARMKLILRGRRWGFSLEEIRQWLEMYEEVGSATQYQIFVYGADQKLEELKHQRDELEATIEELAEQRAKVADLIKSV